MTKPFCWTRMSQNKHGDIYVWRGTSTWREWQRAVDRLNNSDVNGAKAIVPDLRFEMVPRS